MTDSMHRNTPSLTVFDSRGLTVRQTAYYRAQTDAQAQACVNAVVYDSQGRGTAAWDPRLFESRSTQPDLQPNLATVYSLSGAVLSSRSVDAGAALSLSAESGAVLDQWDARATHWQTEYDDYQRPVAIHEQMAGQPDRTCERFTYAGSNAEAALRNQCGQLIRVDDDAGTLAIAEYGLMGGTLMEERRLLTLIEPPDWPPSADERDALLESGQGAITRRQFDANGTAISTTDARGHLQSMGLNIAGQLSQVTLTLMNSTPQVLLGDVQYNAYGQITSETAGNGVISQYLYDDSDARLSMLKVTRAANDPLQLLTYGYDPVGNVTSISDDAQAVRHFANQRIEPISRYTYDSFYQLVETQGRETAKVSSGPQLPDMQPLPIDSSQWLNFTERYRYDSAGNLTQLRHEGSQSYTRDFEIDGSSNRALLKLADSAPPDFASGFDASGNLQYLSPGQTMAWDARNRLLKVTPVSRKDADDDAEHYVYDSSGQRVRKIGTSTARAASHTREVRYFPGLELRSDSANDEQLEVIVIQAGRCAVRCLHWLSGRPADIENDQLRYAIDDHLGSCTLELDGSARLISHEGYYPLGGTAWWAARSAVEAKYKVVRYSGKERDASGLYYYGLRYYAPWLMRWISPDPGGSIDGLNLYTMVRNSPISYIDIAGLEGVVPTSVNWIWLGGPIPDHLSHNIMNFMKLNPGFTATLWVDSTSWQSGHGARLKMLPRRVQIRSVSEIFEGLDPKLYAAFERERSGPLRNYPAASDIARIAILKNKGGVYLDADVQLTSPFQTPLEAKTGVLMAAEGGNFGNAVIAAPPDSPFLAEAALRTSNRYSSRAMESWDTKRSFENSADVEAQNVARAAHIQEYSQQLSSVRKAISQRPNAISFEDLQEEKRLQSIISEADEIRGVDFVPPRRLALTMAITGPAMWLGVLGAQARSSLFPQGQFKPIDADGNAIIGKPARLRRASM